jgi:superfamily I DNA/RNA helicase
MSTTKNVTQRYMKQAVEEPASDVPIVPAGRFIDLAVLIFAYQTYVRHLEATGGRPGPITSKGIAMIKRYGDEIVNGFSQVMAPLAERPDAASIRTVINKATRATSPTPVAIGYWAEAIQATMPWLKTRTTIFNSLFTGKVARAARELAAVADEESPATVLNRLSAIAPVSGVTAPRKWIELLAANAGAPLSTTESVLTDAETGQNLGQDLQQVNTRIDASTPNTPDAADLQAQRTKLVSKIEGVAKKSKAPSAVLSAAATASTNPRRSTIAERFRLTPEQQEVSETMGKVVVAAGAGSGKTTTLVATIANLVENKGYSPDQIMTCSFTRAASAELGLKLERDGKVSGVISGTTHRIARDIIIRHRPNWVGAMRNQRGADRCFKLAIKQVEMSVEGFNQQLEAQKKVLKRIESISGWRSKEILRSFHDQASRGRPLSQKQLDVITKFEGGGGGWRRWAEQAMAPAAPTQEDWMRLSATPPPPSSRARTNSPEFSGSFGDYEDDVGDEETPKIAPDDGRKSKFDQAPVGMWFNIGQKITNDKGEKLGERAALLAVDNFKNSGITVEQAQDEFGRTPIVALYGAYEWLKLNDPVNGPAMDFTDQLSVALDILKTDPQALAAEQSRYKVIMVDEAQDLNQIQFEMFNLMGAKADLLSFIGDDKQSIYAFRGAKPSNYIDLSKSGGYQTKLMTTNFRSGSEIVQAANRLIAHNEDRQIPMVCKAYDARGTGAISAVSPATHEDSANLAAQQIKDGVDAGESASDFGILVRNNAETDAFTLALIVRGIPYRCLKSGQGGYFAKPVVRALTAWTRLAIGGSTADLNDAVITAHQTPGFFLDKMFAANLGRMAKGGNYYDYIASGGEVYTGDQAWRNRNVAAYVDAIRRIKVLGRGESAALIQAILSLKGSKDTFVEALMKLVDEDDVVEEEGGQGGEEAIRQAALAPVRPLMLMAENFSDPENMLAFIAKMKAANEKVEKKSPDTKDDWKEPAVLVGTVHGWKGLETKHVFVSMAGGVFPNFRSDKLAEEQEMTGQTVTAYDEERRLAYVAITRGKDTTTILSPMKTYLGKPAGGSVFINEACIPRQGDPKGEPGVTDYADDNDEPLHPDRVASMQTQSTFVDGLISSMEGMDETPNFITDMML